MKGIQQKITKAAAILVSVFLAGNVTPQTDKEEFEAAKQAYDQSSHDESARLAYVIKLAKIRDRQI